MSKVKKTAVPLPGSLKSKSPKKKDPSPSKKQLSTELVGDSDSDADTNDTPSKPPKKSTPLTIAVHKPNANGTKETKKVEGAAAKKIEAIKARAQAKAAAPKASAPKKAAAPAPEASSSDAESSEESDASVQSKENPSKKAGAKQVSSSSEESTEGGASSSDPDSSSESGNEEAAPAVEVAPKPTQSHTVNFRPAQAYEPPKGFAAVNTSTATKSPATHIFENVDSGKQLWHITAPGDIPLTQLKDFAMEKALSGASILKVKDCDYGFRIDDKNEHGEAEVLIPQAKGYRAVPTRISRTLHLHRFPHLPKIATQLPDEITGSEASASITRSTIKAPRPQLKGLKMRYFHSGFGDQDPGILGDSDSEDDVEMTTAQADTIAGANVIGASTTKKGKRKHEDGEGSAKRAKKHKTAEEIRRKEEKKERKRKEKAKSVS